MEPKYAVNIKYVVTHIKQPALKNRNHLTCRLHYTKINKVKEVISVKTISQLLAIVFLSFTVLTGASLPTDPVDEKKSLT